MTAWEECACPNESQAAGGVGIYSTRELKGHGAHAAWMGIAVGNVASIAIFCPRDRNVGLIL
jgi:hypothetical protein